MTTAITLADVRSPNLAAGDIIQVVPGHLHTVTSFTQEEIEGFGPFEARMNAYGNEIGIDRSRAGSMDDSVRDGKVAVLDTETWSEDGRERHTSGPVIALRAYRA